MSRYKTEPNIIIGNKMYSHSDLKKKISTEGIVKERLWFGTGKLENNQIA